MFVLFHSATPKGLCVAVGSCVSSPVTAFTADYFYPALCDERNRSLINTPCTDSKPVSLLYLTVGISGAEALVVVGVRAGVVAVGSEDAVLGAVVPIAASNESADDLFLMFSTGY